MMVKKMENFEYTGIDDNGNVWSVGLKDLKGRGKLSSYICINNIQFVISNYNTMKSALGWWALILESMKKKDK